jgi:hypothetical protein
MTTLTEFLLARIAEVEHEWGDGAFAPVAGQGLSRLILRTRAECEAKRRIVAEYLAAVENADDVYAYGLESACLLLALPYAAHPDYQQEWRP